MIECFSRIFFQLSSFEFLITSSAKPICRKLSKRKNYSLHVYAIVSNHTKEMVCAVLYENLIIKTMFNFDRFCGATHFRINFKSTINVMSKLWNRKFKVKRTYVIWYEMQIFNDRKMRKMFFSLLCNNFVKMFSTRTLLVALSF